MSDIRDFFDFLLPYCRARIIGGGLIFESFKNLIVTVLVAKRGKHATSFLNTTFLLIVTSAIVAGPIIAEKNPLLTNLESTESQTSSTVLAFDPFENNLSTVISTKPRDKVEEYTVVSGDTLASIAKKFDVSVDSVKWANDITGDTIKIKSVIKIPPITGIVHKVATGDTIYSIAKKYKASDQAIVNFPFNDFADQTTFQLTPGQVIYVPNGVKEEQKLISPNFANTGFNQPGVKGNSNFIWPTTNQVVVTQFPAWYHMALDIAKLASAPYQPIYASDTGTVGFSGCIDWGYGCHIIINHGNGFSTLYGHMSRLDVQQGQVVSQGQQIGVMGSTGRSTGPHLHFEIRSGGTTINPCGYVKC